MNQGVSSGGVCRRSCLDLFLDTDRLHRWRKEQTGLLGFSALARLDACPPPDLPDLPAMLANQVENGLKLVRWQSRKERVQMSAGLLWQTAKAGIWNHVSVPDLFENGMDSLPVKFVLNHPHLVHSFDLPDKGTVPCLTHAYDDIDPLPGVPLWQTLAGPDQILSHLVRFSSSLVLRSRWDQGARIVLGREIMYRFVPPSDLPTGYLDQIHAMVLAGGSVNPTHVRSNLENAFLIGYAMENGKIVGCSCLKNPRNELIQRLKKATGMDFSGCVERGYTSVRPEYRSLGVGRRLLQGLTARAGERLVFAIIDEGNTATQKIARWNDTRKIATYFSEKTNKPMGIWMPSHMMLPPEEPA